MMLHALLILAIHIDLLKTVIQSIQYGKVLIEVIREDGKVYRSDRFKQPSTARFSILDITDFEKNERGHKTKKLKIDLSSMLSTKTDALEEINLDGICVIAIAYPE